MPILPGQKTQTALPIDMSSLNQNEFNQRWHDRLESGRLKRLRDSINRHACAAGLFYDPVNIRYATGTSNMQVYSLHNPCRYVFVAAEGPVILFEFTGCEHLSDDHKCVDEVRAAKSWYHFNSGPRVIEDATRWRDEIVSLMHEYGGGEKTLAVDRLDPIGTHLLEAKGIIIADGQKVSDMARIIKTAEEIDAVRRSIDVCQAAIRRMIAESKPGMTEQQIWSLLHQTNIAMGGEWIETRLFTSGPRTNPWYQEASDKIVEDGEMVSLDSDMVGPLGYSADISRSWVVGSKAPTSSQRRLYAMAHEQVQRNCELFKPGSSLREIADRGLRLPESYRHYEQPAIAHGIGLCNEYPLIMNQDNFKSRGHDAQLEPGMVLCIESYAGKQGGAEGVKLEQQLLITENGHELLSDMEFEANLL